MYLNELLMTCNVVNLVFEDHLVYGCAQRDTGVMSLGLLLNQYMWFQYTFSPFEVIWWISGLSHCTEVENSAVKDTNRAMWNFPI